MIWTVLLRIIGMVGLGFCSGYLWGKYRGGREIYNLLIPVIANLKNEKIEIESENIDLRDRIDLLEEGKND